MSDDNELPCLNCVVLRKRMYAGKECGPGEKGVYEISSITICARHQKAMRSELEYVAEKMRIVCKRQS